MIAAAPRRPAGYPRHRRAKTRPQPKRSWCRRRPAKRTRPLSAPTTVVEPRPIRKLQRCKLPTLDDLPDAYFDMSVKISSQIAANYSNVLLLVAGDRAAEAAFSIVDLARGVALQSTGSVLLVDGDLRYGRLSHALVPGSPGIIEVMLGVAQWEEVIHATNLSRVDFVAAGSHQVPTFDRPEFGWGALRPRYRVVLIGVGAADEPEIAWLAARCDGVYFILSRPNTKRQTASSAVNALRASGANVLGCIVVND